MQQQLQKMGELEEELSSTKVQLSALEEERNRARDELGKMKMVPQEANLKEALSNSKRELKSKEKKIELLKLELERAKGLELKLGERDVLIEKLQKELHDVKSSEARSMVTLSESKKRIREVEEEVERGKQSESKMFETLVSQTKQLELTKIELEESKLEIDSLLKKMEMLEMSSRQSSSVLKEDNFMKETFENLKCDYHLVKENLVEAEESQKVALLQAELLRKEMKMALEAEEKSKKAMDELASVLKEVMTEGNQAKEKLTATQVELEHVKQEAEKVKTMVRSTEDKYKRLLDEARQELDLYKNTSERLRLEAEESLLAWNGKEMGFVSCIKRAEDEKTYAQQESIRQSESVKTAENMTKVSKQENQKLRDILKQALNEANVAKEAASIARDENSQLKDCLSEKDEALMSLSWENERLRIKEAAANESINELNRLLSAARKKELSRKEKDKDKDEGWILMSTSSSGRQELKPRNEHEVVENDEDLEKAEALKGSIFDVIEVSPRSEAQIQRQSASHRHSDGSCFTDSEDYDHLEGCHSDGDRSLQRKKRALLRRFGDILTKRRSFHKKEIQIE